MARKEKSNYTEEHLQFKKQKKYSRPGRPRKIVVEKAEEIAKEEPPKTPSKANTSLDSEKNTSLVESDTSDTIVNDSQICTDDFQGMPKLSPIAKASDIIQSKLNNSVNSTINEEASVEDLEKPFLKPITKIKRERGRPRGSFSARKIQKLAMLEGIVFTLD